MNHCKTKTSQKRKNGNELMSLGTGGYMDTQVETERQSESAYGMWLNSVQCAFSSLEF